MKPVMRVLLIEDSEDDAILLLRELRKGGYDLAFERVDTKAAMKTALEEQTWDVIIADYSMPRFGALDALKLMQSYKLDIPFIIVSGAISEEVAASAMKAGAHDYLMKGNLTRLVPAIERKLQEETLRQTQKLESLGLLAGGVAHDFNNLLVAILGQSSLALSTLNPDSPARIYIERSIKAAERAAHLTRQMLAYSGRGGFEVEPINLNEVIEDNLRLLEAAIPKNVYLHPKLAASIRLIDADVGQVQQVVMNLIINAAEAVGDQPGTVTVATSLQEADKVHRHQWLEFSNLAESDHYVVLEVHDNGPGMDSVTLSKIFDPFFTTKKAGRGLGLAAVSGIVRGHKGGLNVISTVGKGTTFRLAFPACTAKPEPVFEIKKEIKSSSGVILIIDDEMPVVEAITDVLEFYGLQVLTAPSGADGLSIFQEHGTDIDLILLDLSMPGMSGEATFHELCKIKPDVKVVLSSGYSVVEMNNRFVGHKPVGFLGKPYNAGRLIETIQQYMVDCSPTLAVGLS